MWLIENQTPFAAERGWLRDRDGAETWIVAVKATFAVRADGSTVVANEQPPVLRLPEYYGEAGKSSIKYDADIVLTKRTTDVLVIGHASVPGGRATELDVGFRAGPLRKVLRVFGDRRWGLLGPASPQPFERMPLVYERAFGGADARSEHPDRDWEWRNPVGRGFVVAPAHLRDSAPPNIEWPDRLIRAWNDRPPPAGFGAIASHWQPRASYAGTYDDRWSQTRAPLMPDDLDDRFFQCAPPDQQAPQFMYGDESVELLHLHPELPRMRFVLPRIHLGFETHFLDGSRQLHDTRRLHTVILEPDFPRVSLVWHSALSCHFKAHRLSRTVITLKDDVGSGKPASENEEATLA